MQPNGEMTPKEKAQELMNIFRLFTETDSDTKHAALAAINQILKCDLESICMDDGSWTDPERYWQSVKEEIEIL